jgi:hypothetical protein
VTLTAARISNRSLLATCTLSLNITQVILPPTVLDCVPRVLLERNLVGAPAGLVAGGPRAGLVAANPNVGTSLTWSI